MSTLDAERALVGAVLAGYRSPEDLVDVVRGPDFADPVLEQVWDAIGTVIRAGRQPEPIAVREALPHQGSRLPGGAVYLANLNSEAPNVTSAPYYAEQVRAAAMRRRIKTAAQRIAQMADDGHDVDELADRARGEMETALDVAVVHDLQMVSGVLPDVIDIAERGHQSGLHTPWPGIDRMIRGLQPGRLVVVGARPGVGKSLMGTNLAHHVSKNHRKAVLFCSLEMPSIEVVQRLMAHHATVPLGSLDGGHMTDEHWRRVRDHTQELTEAGIYLEGEPTQTLTSIRSAVSRIRRQRDDLAVIVVDYLQLVRPRDVRVNRAEQIGEISRGLKIIARESNTTVVAMAQVNRAGGQRHGGKPTMADLRESGSIEADADIVILLHREDLEDGTPGVDIEVLIEKNRSGPRGVTTLQIQGTYARLVDRWSPADPPLPRAVPAGGFYPPHPSQKD